MKLKEYEKELYIWLKKRMKKAGEVIVIDESNTPPLPPKSPIETK